MFVSSCVRSRSNAAMYSNAGSLPHMMSMGQHASQMLPPPQPHAHYASAPANSKYPPPLVSVNGTTPSARYPYSMTSNGTDVIDLSSPPQSPQMAQRQHHVSNGKTTQPMDRLRLIQIPDFSTSGSHTPFKVRILSIVLLQFRTLLFRVYSFPLFFKIIYFIRLY